MTSGGKENVAQGTGHKIYARHSGVAKPYRLSVPLIKRCIHEVLRFERADAPCEVSVLITDDRGIQKINREFRNIDEPTDVLSFPMQEISSPGWAAIDQEATDQETGLLPLGEIVLSAERVINQAREFGQSCERETAYLTAHAALHLLGYDHIDEAEGKKMMRERENSILKEMGFRC